MIDNDRDENALQEVVAKVVITPEDVTGAADFWVHFEVNMPQELKDAFGKFVGNPTFENQDALKLELVKAIGYTEHDAFRDEMFKEITEECRNVTYDMSFDDALEKKLVTETNDKK